jgi:Tfp pilus assembly protein PilX
MDIKIKGLTPMINTASILKNDRGSTIIIAVMILVFLTIIGIAATNTSIFESKIVGNDHRYQIEFYVADSGWKQGAMWLESLAGPPAEVNPGTDRVVKNFGFNTAAADPAPDNLAALAPDNTTVSQYNIPYWYQMEYERDGTVDGSGKGVREFEYRTTSNANQTQEIEVVLAKLFKVGY